MQPAGVVFSIFCLLQKAVLVQTRNFIVFSAYNIVLMTMSDIL